MPESYIRPTLSHSAMGFKINYAAISYSKRVHRCHQPFRPSAPALTGQFNLATGGKRHLHPRHLLHHRSYPCHLLHPRHLQHRGQDGDDRYG